MQEAGGCGVAMWVGDHHEDRNLREDGDLVRRERGEAAGLDSSFDQGSTCAWFFRQAFY